MNDRIWKLLQIEPTTDQTQIKRAYASQSKLFHPEEDPEGFMRLRQAYSLALEWAENAGDQIMLPDEKEETRVPWGGRQKRERSREERPEEKKSPEPGRDREEPQDGEPDLDKEETGKKETVSQDIYEPVFVFRQEPDGPNPYRESDVYRAFLAVYKKENQKNWKIWMEYFTSPDFLSVSHEEDFCALIKETVREKEAEFKPGQEFIKGLYTAYCLTAEHGGEYGGEEHIVRQEQNGQIAPEPIFDIARAYPVPRKVTGNDQIMKAAFSNYYHLRMDEGMGWTDGNLRGLRIVLERYVSSYIKDNYTGDGQTEYARHPLSLRLLNYFFDTAELDRECYQIAWETLGLKQAVMGRNKLLYGRLREICLEKCPELDGEDTAGFFAVNRDFGAYVEKAWSDSRQEEQSVAEFFEREDVKRALRNRRYVETNVLTYWISLRRSQVFLRYLHDFYEADRTAPCAREVLQAILGAEVSRRIYGQNTEDTEAPASAELISVNYRPFLRYFLNTAFRDFRDLGLYLLGQLPCSPEWTRRLLGLEEGGKPVVICRRIVLDGAEIEILMHLYYVEYRVDGREMHQPFLSYERIAALATEEFLLLLPAAVPAGDESKPYLQNAGVSPESRKLAKELQERFAETALPPENRAKTAEYLGAALMERFYELSQAEHIGAALPLTVYRETQDALYCARWIQEEHRMSLYVEQGQNGMLLHSSEVYDFVEDGQQAADLGKRLLDQLIAPASIDSSCMDQLPENVYISRPAAPVSVLAEEDITTEALNGILEQFAQGELNRLEFSFAPKRWELKAEEVETYPRKRSLVFLKQDEGYTCLFFDDTRYIFYAFIKKSNSIGAADNEYISLTQKKFPWQGIFNSFDSIRCNLEQILRMASKSETFQRLGSVQFLNGCAWRDAWGGIFIQNRRVKYNLAKQELGKFPLERAYNSERQPVLLDSEPDTLNRHPLELEQQIQDGTINIVRIDGKKKPLFTEAMKRFFQGDVVRLRLSWDVSPDEYRKYFAPQFFEEILDRRMGEPMRSHIVLCRDGGRYTMLCLQDLAEKAEYYVADIGTYMDVEGKKYPKENFLGKMMPAYLIHKDPVALRNRLDLLLDRMECLLPITRRFAEFASENPVKDRDYDTIRGEFVRS